MVEELKLAIKVDDDAVEQALLKQFANAEKMANKVVLTFNNIDLDDKVIEAKFKEMQKMAGKNPIDLSIDKSSIEMLSAISEQLGNIFNIAKGKSIIDSSAIDNDAIKTTISLFEKIESSITAIRKVFADVGDGEEFSPLLKMINNVQSSISELATSVKGIGLNMNIDVRSDDELDRRLQTKVANALQAYQKLFDNIKMTSAGGSLINQEFFDFNLDNYDTAYQKLQAIVNFIKKQRVEAKKQFNGYDALYEDSDKSLWKSAQAYLAQVTKAETEIKKANSGESNPLENLFGNTKDLSEVIEQLNKVVEKLNEISSSATEFKNIFKEGFNVTASVEEIDKLTNRVKELEDELSKIKLNSVNVDKSNISSGTQIKDVFQGGTTSAEKLEGEIKNIDSATEKASESAKEYRKILSQVGEFDIDSKVSAMYKRNDGQLESWTWRAKKDDEGNVLYDQNGKIDYDEPTITVISKYEQLEKIIVKADNELRNLQKDLAEIKAYDPTASTTNIEAKISDQKEYVQLLEQTVKVISQSDEYLLDEQQIIEARNKAAREYALTTGAKQEKTDAKQSASDEKKRLANIEQVNRALNKQQITIDSIEKTYNKTTNPDLDREVSNQQDLAELAQKKLAIQTKINLLQGQERNSTNEKEFLELEKLIAEYKELAKYKLKANNPSKQELGGQNLQTLIAQQISQYDKLITKAENFGDETSETVKKLKEQRDILAQTDVNGKYTATADDYYNSRDNYKVESAYFSAFESKVKSVKQEIKSLDKDVIRFKGELTNFTIKPDNDHSFQSWKDQLVDLDTQILEYGKKVQKVKEIQASGGIVDEKDIENIKEQKKYIEDTIRLMKRVPSGEKGWTDVAATKTAERLNELLEENSRMSKQAKDKIRAYYDELVKGNPSKPLNEIYQECVGIVQKEREAERAGKSWLEVFKDKKIYNFLGQAASMFSFYDLINLGRQGFTVIKDLDSALTEMRKVSDETVSSLKKFQTASFDVSQQVGATALEIQNSAADFMRLGYSLKDASKFAEDANIYANVGDMDISEATEHMISSIQAWQSEFSNATEASTNIIDRYNEVGNRFAITSADIGSAMERSAAALKAGGNTLNESIGLITAGNLIQQDADTTANALKVMSLRIRGAKADLESMGESTDDLANSTSKLRDQIKSLTGVDIMIDENTFKSTARIIQEIGAEWEKLTDVSKASTLELLAGKTRASTVAGLLENYQTIGEVIKAAEESSGSARKENERYLESINGKIALLTNNLQKLAYDVIESELLKSIVDFGSGTIKVLDSVVTVFDKINSSITSLGGLLGESNGLAGTFGIISGLLMNKAGIGECTTF